MSDSKRGQVVVVGGGVAGLAAATFAARSGASVMLLEALTERGGRSRTREEQGFHFNMGPHALYRNGPAEAVLEELGIRVAGAPPDLGTSLAWCEGRLAKLPGGPLSLLTTRLLGAREKAAMAALFVRLPKLDPTPWQGRSLRELLTERFQHPRLRQLFAALVRLSSYAHAPEVMSAGLAIQQLQTAVGAGVRYVDGGWQSIVASLEEAAREAGVVLRSGVRVRAIESRAGGSGAGAAGSGVGATGSDGSARWSLKLRDDSSGVVADAVVLAMGPEEASRLVADGRDPVLAEQAGRALPVRAACLDVGLSRRPRPRHPFALGIDEPTYLSLHSSGARGMAPDAGALFQVARYLSPDEKPGRAEIQAQLETLLDAVQPGWREVVCTKKLLLDLRVAHSLPTAEMGGLAGRPGVDALEPRWPGLLLAGDWIGPTGWLVDGALASGRDAGRAAARHARGARDGPAQDGPAHDRPTRDRRGHD